MEITAKRYTLGEEIFNSVTHGVGTLLSIAGCAVLITLCALNKGAMEVISASIYGASLIILYAMSTLYHALTNRTAKKVFRILDHSTIFLLIAGTYTPLTLCCLKGALGWTVFGLIWGAAILGIVLTSVNLDKFRKISTICYIFMGWGIIIAIKPLCQSISVFSLLMLIGGGLLYSLGVIFYVKKNCKYMHSIWHIFVIGGSVLHYFSIMDAVLK